MTKNGKVVRWEAAKGFGFIRSPDTDADVFFHIRDVQGGEPSVGQSVVYEEIHVGGKGPRAMAVKPVPGASARPPVASRRGPPAARTSPGRSSVRASLNRADPWLWPLMAVALVEAGVLAWAVHRGALPLGLLLAWPVLNLVTFWFYWHDKHAARRGAWRVPEDRLQLFSLLGGWPAARLAQQVLRHKSSKASFQLQYGLMVLVHLGGLAAVLHWRGALPQPI
jgi:uncharacterized membrane protein YsdA (DUF1294 family)/cold shock CspA family protein